MSGISSVNSTSSTSNQGTLGNAAPISFPGISSGIDYNAIIQKLTALTLAQNTPLRDQVTQLNSQNSELIKIKGLINSVQGAITSLADPAGFNSFSATSSNLSVATAAQTPNATPSVGTTTIQSQTLATSTVRFGDVGANKVANTGVSLATAGFQITPSNGTGGSGKFTVNGQQITFDVGTDTITTIVAKLNALTNVTASFAGDKLTITSTLGPLQLGSASDSGNLAQIFKIDVAQITGGGTTVTSAGTVGGINPLTSLSTAKTNVAINGGNTFSINGVAISVNPATDALSDVIKRINASTAGVLAAWDQTAGRITITAKATGPQSIVLGAPGDNSNFLTAFGVTSAGATTTTGSQASVTYLNSGGVPTTVYSNSNAVTNVIPGVTLNLTASTATPYTVTVATDTTKLTAAISGFVTAYNAAIVEINKATTPPVVQTAGPGTPLQPGATNSSTVVPGGVLWQNTSVQALKDQLVTLVSALVPTGSTSVNSLASVGLQLTNSFSVITSKTTSAGTSTSKDSTNDSSPLQAQTFAGTDGQLQALDTTKLQSALSSNPLAVQKLFIGADSISQQMGSYLTFVTGTPTQLGPTGGFANQVPTVSLIQGIENTVSAQIDSINQQIALVNNTATQQANTLRQEFVSSEARIAQLQQEQASLSSFLNSASSTGH